MNKTGFRILASTVLIALMLPLIAACGKTTSTSSTATTPAKTQTSATATQPSTTVKSTTSATTPTTTTASGPQGTLRIAWDDLGKEQWLPNTMSSTAVATIGGVFDFLVERKIPTRELLPGAAEKWTISPDGLTWTFYLRKGIQFHDNWGELTAADVKLSIDLAAKAGSVNTQGAYFRALTVDVIDPYQINFRTKTVDVTLPYQMSNVMANLPIVSSKYIQSVGEAAAAAHPIGSGPYKFVEMKAGDYVKMEALPTHWRKTGEFQTVYAVVVPEQSTRLAMLKTGQLDIAPLSLSYKKEAQSMGITLSSQAAGSEIFLTFGGLYLPTRPTFDPTYPWVGDPKDPASMAKALKVRQALCLAVDTKQIISTVLQGEGTQLAVTPSFVEFAWNDPAWKPYPYDPQKAKQLLAEAGYPTGFTTKMRIFDYSGLPEGQDISEAIAQYWEKVGITVKRDATDYPTDRQNNVDRKLSGIADVRGMSLIDEPALQGAIRSNSAVNYTGESAFIDDILTKAGAEPDLQKRVAMYRQLGQYFYDNYNMMPIAIKNNLYGVGPKVGKMANLNGYGFVINVEYITRSGK